MLIVNNFGLKIVLYKCITVVKLSYAYFYQALISFTSFVAKYWLCRLGLNKISTRSSSVAWNRLSNSWNNNSYCMWLQLWPFELRDPKHILFSLAFYDSEQGLTFSLYIINWFIVAKYSRGIWNRNTSTCTYTWTNLGIPKINSKS
jgi:hypothetical protein